MSKKKKKQTIIESVELCQGVKLGASFYEKQENRLLTLLQKGFIVYLLTMGSIGFFLSAIDVQYNELLCHIIIFLIALACAMLYYRLAVENIGYFVLLVTFSGLVFMFRSYINSGYYAVLNVTQNIAAQYFDIDIQRQYQEQIDDRYVTITCLAVFIGVVLSVLLNVYISRRMQYATAIFIVMFLNVVPLYLAEEPHFGYAVMLLAGIVLAYVFKSGQHYSPQVSIKRDNRIYRNIGRNGKPIKEISYVYDVRAHLQTGIIAAALVVALTFVVSAVRPEENFNSGYSGNKYKQRSMSVISSVILDGFMSLFDGHYNTGGLQSGELGNVSTVRLNYEDILSVQYTPYSYDTVYIKSFVGERYNPYQNNWDNIITINGFEGEYYNPNDKNASESDYNYYAQTPEADAYQEAYEAGEDYTAKGYMKIKNLSSYFSIFGPYYYSSYKRPDSDGYYTWEYYPAFSQSLVNVPTENYKDMLPYHETDLEVPKQNQDVIDDFITEIGLQGTDEQVIAQLKEYFQNNVPYTIRPGKTPRGEDFVNYFLTTQKRGYCSYFASSAVLILRYMGIPARYVEGFAVDYEQTTINGELVDDADYNDYYDGYSELGETALVETSVTDADAHAWVEVYSQEKGWYVVDITPSSGGEEIPPEDFWSNFADNLDSSDTGNTNLITGDGFRLSARIIKGIGIAAIVALSAALIIFIIARGRAVVIFIIGYARADINDKLIIHYRSFRKKMARRDKKFGSLHNYDDQLKYLGENYILPEENAAVLQRAAYSRQLISKEENETARRWLRAVKKQARSVPASK